MGTLTGFTQASRYGPRSRPSTPQAPRKLLFLSMKIKTVSTMDSLPYGTLQGQTQVTGKTHRQADMAMAGISHLQTVTSRIGAGWSKPLRLSRAWTPVPSPTIGISKNFGGPRTHPMVFKPCSLQIQNAITAAPLEERLFHGALNSCREPCSKSNR